MEDLIKALQIFLKYRNDKWPIWFDCDALIINGIELHEVSSEDVNQLYVLSFYWNTACKAFVSYRFGSC